MEFLNDQVAVNGVLIFMGTVIIMGILKLSWVQDTIKDEIDDIFKKMNP